MKMYTQEEILAMDLSQLMNACDEAFHSERNRQLMRNDSQIRYRVGIGRTVFAKAFGFSTLDYYHDMPECLKQQLRWKLWNFCVLQDDTPFDMEIGIDYATAYEPSFYGMDYHMLEGVEPTYGDPIIKDPEDLRKIKMPDFYTSGLMPTVIRQYEELNTLVDDRFHVFFPGFARGPWSIATILRGFNDLFIDVKEDPEFVHELMQFAVDSRISWEKQRCEFLGIDPKDSSYRWKYIIYRDNWNSDSFEDEVNGNMFSRETFEEFVLPYEKQLADFYDGIGYYHSCGSLTPFLDDLKTVKIKGMQHVSAWTDYRKAVEKTQEGTIVQVSLDPRKEVLTDENVIRERIRFYIDNSSGRHVDLCPDAIYDGGQEVLDKMVRFTQIMREELQRTCSRRETVPEIREETRSSDTAEAADSAHASAIIEEISALVQKGRAKKVKELVQQALDENEDPQEILNNGLLGGMMIIGEKFKRDEVYVPDVMVSARAMNFGISVLEPVLVEMGNKPLGKAVIGTVKDDLHDIGKNLVSMMLKAAGFEIYDIGVDRDAAAFVDKAEEVGADIIGMSALLTTTMQNMEDVITLLKERNIRDKYIVMVGGAPIDESFAQEIGADYYTPDATICAEIAKKAVLERQAANA